MDVSPVSGILPYAKHSGITSFASLGCIKKALHTKKVGHTGTLDSFAEGLLVVLTGSLTRLVPYFTLFDKTYEAVISFGEETDTLDPCGTVVRSAPLPDTASFERAFASFRGNLMQRPPSYSAVHVNGKRASDLAREGRAALLPERAVAVYQSDILEMRLVQEDRQPCVRYARVFFHVSKGTYIRSLARDLALACGSAAHLIGLKRTKVGCFDIAQASFSDMLGPFTIDSVLSRTQAESSDRSSPSCSGDKSAEDGENLIRRSLMSFDRQAAKYCGLGLLTLRPNRRFDFANGKTLKPDFFTDFERFPRSLQAPQKVQMPIEIKVPQMPPLDAQSEPQAFAVFLPDGTFLGVVEPSAQTGKLAYGFVIH